MLSLTIYTFATLWGVPQIGRWFFRRFGHDESAEFIFVLATLFIISYIAGYLLIVNFFGKYQIFFTNREKLKIA